jgi:DNA-binding transcriptional regulator YhcF (GntR family)
MPTRRVDRNAYTPAYAQLADILREQIAAGEYPPGEYLPSERQLGQEHDLGVITVRKSIAILRSEGLLVTERGVGNRVRETGGRTVERIRPGERVTVRPATLEERRRLKLAEGAPVAVITSAGGGDQRVVSAYDVEFEVSDSD